VAHGAAREYLTSDTARLRLESSRQELWPWVDEKTRLVPADEWLTGPKVLTVGGVRFDIQPVGPSHTAEDLVVYLPQKKVLFAGDLVFRNRIPFVMGVLDAKKIAAEIPNYDLAIIFHESAQHKLTEIVKPGVKKVLAIIGPEGGITDEELAIFKGAGAQVALMGRPIFRSAHAGMAALSGLNAALEIW
jgi:hypothetical protein